MTELELRLHELREEIAWPEASAIEPDLRAVPATPRRRWQRELVVALAVLLLGLAAVLAFSGGARSAFLELFHIRGATVERVEQLPKVPTNGIPLGQKVSRAEAERRLGVPLVDVGEPDNVYVRGDTVSLVYGPSSQPRLVLTEGPGRLWDGFVKKIAATGTKVEQVTVGGEPGLFVSGEPHVVMFIGRNGQIEDEQSFLAGTVLLWNRGPLLLRMEGDLTRDEAVELAETAQ
jgi:hypothetical protein